MKPPVVILAAGASERLGLCKALAPLAGKSALERLLASAVAGGAEEIAVVGGAHCSEIAEELARIDRAGAVQLLVHPGWSLGRTGSVAAAAESFPGRELLIAPIDVPLVSAATFRRLFEAWATAGDPPRGWLAPATEDGRFGHPVLLGPEIAGLVVRAGPETALARLRDRADPLWAVTVPDPAILDDLDTPEDLERLSERLR